MAKRYKVSPTAGTAQKADPVYVFTAVRAIRGRQAENIPHVNETISLFLGRVLDTKDWTVEKATAHGFVSLVEFLADQKFTGVPRSFREQRFNYNIQVAACEGHPAVLDWWLTTYLPERADTAHEKIFKLACKYEHLNVLHWLHNTGRMPSDFSQNGFEVTCESLDFARWLHENAIGIQLKLSVAHCASKYGNIELIKWARTLDDHIQYTITGVERAIAECAILGLWDDLLWLHVNRPERCSLHVLSKTVASGHLHIVKWLLQNYASDDLNDLTHGCSDLATAEWILSNYKWKHAKARINWIENSIETAAGENKTDLIEFLYSIRPKANAHMAFSIAAGCGDLEMLQLLHRHKAKTTKNEEGV